LFHRTIKKNRLSESIPVNENLQRSRLLPLPLRNLPLPPLSHRKRVIQIPLATLIEPLKRPRQRQHLRPSATAVFIASTYRYNSRDLPPFIVQVQSTQESAYSHPLHISKTVSKILPGGISEIRKTGRSKVLVQTCTYEVANRLVENISLSSYNLKAFIPSYRVLRCGIIRDVPQDVPIDTLKESISSPIKILDLHRLNRRVKTDNEIRYIPSRTLCIKFSGQSLPQYIYFFNCRYSVTPFIPKTRICFSCYRVGHLSKSCKSRPRCLFCGEPAHDSPDSCPLRLAPKCINCKGVHLATSHECIKVIEHKMAHSLAATENISFTDALCSINSSSPYSSPPSSSPSSLSDPRFDFQNFPLLPKSRTSRSPSHLFSVNRFAPLANTSSSSGDPVPPFSSILKHSTPLSSAPRALTSLRYKKPMTPSTAPPPSFLPPVNHHSSPFYVPAYPKAHRDLLLEPHGRPLPLSEDLHPYSSSLSPHLPNRETASGHPETSLSEVIQLLSHHAIMLQHLLNTSPYPILIRILITLRIIQDPLLHMMLTFLL